MLHVEIENIKTTKRRYIFADMHIFLQSFAPISASGSYELSEIRLTLAGQQTDNKSFVQILSLLGYLFEIK